MANNNINLVVAFDATAGSPRVRATEIAEMVRTFLTTSLVAANVRVEVHGAALNFVAAYERERDALAHTCNDVSPTSVDECAACKRERDGLN
jgi:hypothetical protein